jgi:hypothetical protein
MSSRWLNIDIEDVVDLIPQTGAAREFAVLERRDEKGELVGVTPLIPIGKLPGVLRFFGYVLDV